MTAPAALSPSGSGRMARSANQTEQDSAQIHHHCPGRSRRSRRGLRRQRRLLGARPLRSSLCPDLHLHSLWPHVRLRLSEAGACRRRPRFMASSLSDLTQCSMPLEIKESKSACLWHFRNYASESDVRLC